VTPEEQVAHRNALVLRFSRLAHRIAFSIWQNSTHIRRRSGSLDDILQDTYVALIKLADLYESDRGAAEGTFLQKYGANHAVREAWRAGWLVHIPPHAMRDYKNMSPEEQQLFDKAAMACVSEGAGEWLAVSNDFDAIEAVDEADANSRHVARLLATLHERDAEMLRRWFGLDGRKQKSLTAIGVDLGISKERVRQVVTRALEKLRSVV
jgi:RNA polymerase sigma factor (sigma-70 family)